MQKVLLPIITLGIYFLIAQVYPEAQSLQLAQTEDRQIFQAYLEWKSLYRQNFNGNEENYRYSQFRENYMFAESHNTKNESLKLGMTQFAAMSNSEFQSVMTVKRSNKMESNVQYYKTQNKSVPESVDWRTKGAVFEAQNQGICGSCWAFSSIGALQGLRKLVTGKLELLSAQQLTSCIPSKWVDDKTQGCNGSEPQYAYQYTAENGIELASSYPYTNGNAKVASPCKYDASKVVFKNQGYQKIKTGDIQGMKESLVQQVISIAVDAGSIYFQLYRTGVISNTNCGTDLNHAIIAVGYNTSEQTPYWIVQNSWGTGWGENGFGKIAITEGNGVCGINMDNDFPTSVNQEILN